MLSVLGIFFSILCYVGSSNIPRYNVEPEFLDMLRETGQHEELAKYLGIEDVSLVLPVEGRTEEELMFTTVSAFGDILLTPEQEEQARQGIRFDRSPDSRWPDNTIPYVIAGYLPSQRRNIESAIDSLNARTKNVNFVKRNGQSDYVFVMSGRGCYSNLGRVGGAQTISLQNPGCLSTGTIQHEFIHASGIIHEHNRPNRDEYVNVLFENISPEWRSQYQKTDSQDIGDQGPYEYNSVMHYPLNAPNSNKPAFEILNKTMDSSRLGQRDGATPTDVQKLDALYS